jgi:glycosyltransferase involved in cell wall biosynthesis
MLTTFYPPYHFGGDAMGVQRLSRALVRRGHHVTVVHDADTYRILSGGREPEPAEEPEGLDVVTLESGLGTLGQILTQQSGRPVVHGDRIARVLDEGNFDVVTFHNVSQVGGPGLLRYGTGVKLYMAHEHWLVCPSHVLWRHGRELCTGRECLRCVLSYRRPPQAWRYTGFLERELHHVDEFIAMSEFSRKKHAEFGFPREMTVMPYFLPDAARDETAGSGGDETPRPHDRPYFLFVGRLEPIKGLDDVIPLFRDFPDADLVIAGDGTHADELRRIAGGAPNVRFLGRLPPDGLAPWYENALALVVPSVCFETFGIILIESMRRGTPVLARRIGPFPEIVDASGAGELFDGPDELLACLRRMTDDPERTRRMGAAGREAQERLWSESAVVPQYLSIVRRVAERRGLTEIVESLSERVLA